MEKAIFILMAVFLIACAVEPEVKKTVSVNIEEEEKELEVEKPEFTPDILVEDDSRLEKQKKPPKIIDQSFYNIGTPITSTKIRVSADLWVINNKPEDINLTIYNVLHDEDFWVVTLRIKNPRARYGVERRDYGYLYYNDNNGKFIKFSSNIIPGTREARQLITY